MFHNVSRRLSGRLGGIILGSCIAALTVAQAPAADSVKFSAPTQIVCIGDDIWNMDKTRNAATILQSELEKTNPGLVSVKLFAVGGDNTVSLEARFNQQPVADWTTYWPLLESKPDWVFLELGMRDTIARSLNQFQTSLVPPADQKESLTRLLTSMRRIWPKARIVLLSPTPFHTQKLAADAQSALDKGAPDVWRVGDDAKIAAYKKVLSECAAKLGAEYFDVHGALTKQGDLAALWKDDGIHLTEAGHQRLADLLLQYIAKHPVRPAAKALPAPASGDVVFRLDKRNIPANPPWNNKPFLVSDKNGSGQKMLSYGKYTASRSGYFQADGAVAGGILADSNAFTPEKGATFIATVRNEAVTDSKEKRMFSSYFYKSHQFLFCRFENKLYFNIYANGNWSGGFDSADVFDEPQGKESFHQAALTVRHHKVPSQGEDWVEVRLYLDGEPVGQKRLLGVAFPDSPYPVECGSASSLGYVWRFKGEAAEYRIYRRVLNDSEIEDIANAEVLLKRKSGNATDPAVQKILNKLPKNTPRRSAAENLAHTLSAAELQAALANQKALVELQGKDSVLTVLNMPGKSRIASWFDRKTNRELLTHDSAMFSVKTVIDGKTQLLSPLTANAASTVTVTPTQKDGRWLFTVRTRFAPDKDAFAETRYSFAGDQLRYETSLDAGNTGWRFTELNQPALRLKPLQSGQDYLLAPIMSGVAYPGASRDGAVYDDHYPHGTGTMQLGAYYDDQSGVYWTVTDARARRKHLEWMAGGKRITVNVGWTVPGKSAEEQKKFHPEAEAVVELFRGNWYDVGLLYRRDLAAMNAFWWRKSLPNTDTPEWFRENCFILRKLVNNDTKDLKPMRDYFGMPYTMAYSSSYAFNNYSPFYRLNPMDIAYAEYLHSIGVHAYPYTDPRLWSHTDRRDEDYKYTELGKDNCIIVDGKEYIEHYGNEVCSITCPATETVRKITLETLNLIVHQGFDGVYCDQIGAAAPLPCENPNHGHVVCDPDAYVRDGWKRIFDELRAGWKADGLEKIIVTEDNAEECVGFMDGVLPWRWMYDHQVPLYPQIYAGRTQFTGREPDCEDPAAIFVKAAIQLVNSEQMGWIETGLVTSPLRHDYRVFMRQMLWLRKGMLDFFNEGEMMRPPRFADKVAERPLRWGVRGTGMVTSPDLVASAWKHRDCYAFVVVNHTKEALSNALLYTLPQGKYAVKIWQSNEAAARSTSSSEALKIDFTLPSHASMLVLVAPMGADTTKLEAKIQTAFAEIRKSPKVPDPFVVEPASLATAVAGDAGSVHEAKDIPAAVGCRLNREHNQVDYVRDALISVGEVDFGNGGWTLIRASFAAPPRCGTGSAEFFVDDVKAENCFAAFSFDGANFLTKNWNEFADRTAPVTLKLTGKHRVFVKLEGSSFCNMRSWNLLKGETK